MFFPAWLAVRGLKIGTFGLIKVSLTYLLNYLNLRLIGKQRELADWEYDGRERQLSTNMFPGFYLLLCESIFVWKYTGQQIVQFSETMLYPQSLATKRRAGSISRSRRKRLDALNKGRSLASALNMLFSHIRIVPSKI